jgi:hypothetical protein
MRLSGHRADQHLPPLLVSWADAPILIALTQCALTSSSLDWLASLKDLGKIIWASNSQVYSFALAEISGKRTGGGR